MRGSLQSYGIDAIHVPDRLRPLREDRIAMLVDSIAELGLQTPITVCIHERVNIPGEGEVWEVPVLVAGRHRLEATRRLGLSDIACMVVQADADHCRLWEIDENLARAELTATEEAEHLYERKRVWERIQATLRMQLEPAWFQTIRGAVPSASAAVCR
jgi:ParB/RepB/Spo0J family partition protein